MSATISAGLADGKTIGQGLDEMDKIAKETLGRYFPAPPSPVTQRVPRKFFQSDVRFHLAILLIYLILAAQFESFKDPLIIMLTVPLAIAGALVFMYFGGITMNIFSQIGIIMLIGLVAKRYPDCRVRQSETGNRRGQDASHQRCRPATSAPYPDDERFYRTGTDTAGIRHGRRCNQRIAMGTAVVGGMLVSTLLTMYIVPLFIVMYLPTEVN